MNSTVLHVVTTHSVNKLVCLSACAALLNAQKKIREAGDMNRASVEVQERWAVGVGD